MSDQDTLLISEDKKIIDKVLSYAPQADKGSLEQAINFAKTKHSGQMRASGEPYYTHPLEVADILADMKMDPATIKTAILHDTLEDTDATDADLIKLFGKEINDLVNGVTKLTQIESKTAQGKQAENFRKLVLAMSEDIRVLLVKLADRLHNMRTLYYIKKPEKRARIARETLEIHAPLAERIGIHKIKEELEDLAFSYLNPEARESIINRLSYLRKEGTDLVKNIIDELSTLVSTAGVEAEITGREKTRFSIWKKMQRKNVSFEQLSDIMAFRIVVNDMADCYTVLGIIHSRYPTVPGRFKDFISTPKPNGYKSVHTTVLGPENHRIEIQIRTNDMHKEADLGIAAHWSYKQGGPKSAVEDAKKYRWLRELLDILEQEQRPEDFLENTKLELFQEQVYVFTPKGDLFELPNGATPIDFAYAIHSDVGNSCTGAKINGRIVPLNSKLQNGDQIDVITSKSQVPSPTWERFVVTGKAKSHIRRFVRLQQRDEFLTLGKAMLQRLFQTEGYELSEKQLQSHVKKFTHCQDIEDVYVGVGSGHIVARDVFKIVFPSHKSTFESNQTVVEKSQRQKSIQHKKNSMPIKGLIPGMAVHYAKCCHPLPGDRIVGIVSTGRGVTIHTIDCDTLEQFADTPERWLDVSWEDGPDSPETHVGRLDLTISNMQGALGTISQIVTKNDGDIINLKITHRSVDFWDMYVDIYVKNTTHLKNIIAALRSTNHIISVDRSKNR